jgi:hypothetical protein
MVEQSSQTSKGHTFPTHISFHIGKQHLVLAFFISVTPTWVARSKNLIGRFGRVYASQTLLPSLGRKLSI